MKETILNLTPSERAILNKALSLLITQNELPEDLCENCTDDLHSLGQKIGSLDTSESVELDCNCDDCGMIRIHPDYLGCGRFKIPDMLNKDGHLYVKVL